MRASWRVVILLVILAGGVAAAVSSGAGSTPSATSKLQQLLRMAERATVEVEAGTQKGPDGIFASHDRHSVFGSGFFISPTEVVTAGHVVYSHSLAERAHRSPLYVLMPAGERYEAKLIGVDVHDDIALLSVAGHPPVTSLKLARKLPRPGEPVIALGALAGEWPTVTAGIVGRAETATGDFGHTGNVLGVTLDIEATEGSSGSPVFNAHGEVIGAILEYDGRTGEPTQIARPADVIRADIAQLRRGVTLSNPLDHATLLTVNPETMRALHLASPHGLLVEQIETESALYSAGVRAGDELLMLEGQPLDSPTSALKLLLARTPAQALTLTYAHGTTKESATIIIEVEKAPT